MDGLNKSFMADPQKFLKTHVILVPAPQDSWCGPLHDATFDLRPDPRQEFGSDTCLLSTMARRGKAPANLAHPIPGSWVPLRANSGSTREKIKPTDHGFYCVFTERLGGCSIGIKSAATPETLFYHNPGGKKDPDFQLNLPSTEYDPGGKGANVAGVCWWNGAKWQIGHCRSFDASPWTELVGQDKYDKKLKRR